MQATLAEREEAVRTDMQRLQHKLALAREASAREPLGAHSAALPLPAVPPARPAAASAQPAKLPAGGERRVFVLLPDGGWLEKAVPPSVTCRQFVIELIKAASLRPTLGGLATRHCVLRKVRPGGRHVGLKRAKLLDNLCDDRAPAADPCASAPARAELELMSAHPRALCPAGHPVFATVLEGPDYSHVCDECLQPRARLQCAACDFDLCDACAAGKFPASDDDDNGGGGGDDDSAAATRAGDSASDHPAKLPVALVLVRPY
jgi:hypothetical protein